MSHGPLNGCIGAVKNIIKPAFPPPPLLSPISTLSASATRDGKPKALLGRIWLFHHGRQRHFPKLQSAVPCSATTGGEWEATFQVPAFYSAPIRGAASTPLRLIQQMSLVPGAYCQTNQARRTIRCRPFDDDDDRLWFVNECFRRRQCLHELVTRGRGLDISKTRRLGLSLRSFPHSLRIATSQVRKGD
jgi:hypothetical protein